MDKFVYIYTIIFVNIVFWHITLLFLSNDSKFQKARFRRAIDKIHEHIMNNTEKSHPPIELNIIYKNKKFAVGIIKDEVGYYYSTYHIFINGEEAGCYHYLHGIGYNAYYFEAINRRHRHEVEAIIYAAANLLKRDAKAKKEKKDGYTEYSYFK